MTLTRSRQGDGNLLPIRAAVLRDCLRRFFDAECSGRLASILPDRKSQFMWRGATVKQ